MRSDTRSLRFRLLAVSLAFILPAGTLGPAYSSIAGTSASARVTTGQDPTIMGLDAYNAMLKELAGLLPELVRDRPTGKENERETAFKALSAVYFAMIFGSVAITPGCAALGAGIGACFAGVGAGPGALIGGGSGAIISVAGVTVSTIALVGLYFYVNEKYPYKEAASGDRGLKTVSFRRGAAEAGPYESLLIQLIDAAFPNDVIRLATEWDTKAGLSAKQREFLRGIAPLRPQIQAIAEVKKSKCLFPGGPVAQPLSGWMAEGLKLIKADSDTMESIWLKAFGIGAIGASVRNSKLTVKLPPTLVEIGAPAEASIPVPGFGVKVGGTGGAFDPYLATTVSAGPFSINWGTASLIKSGADAGRILVKYSIAKGSRLGHAAFRMKWNGPVATLADFAPTLASGFDGRVYFKPVGHGLQIDRITLGDISLSLNLPGGIPNNLPGVSDLIKQLQSGIENGLRGMLKELAWTKALDPLKTYPAQSLLKELRSRPSEFGFQEIAAIQQLRVEGGRLGAQVRAKYLNPPTPDQTPRQVAIELAKYRLAQRRAQQNGTAIQGQRLETKTGLMP